MFAKTVDHQTYWGERIPGDPQPENLAEYAATVIDPVRSPIIDQNLLGRDFWVMMNATITDAPKGSVMKNQAHQLFENNTIPTMIVSNPLAPISPDKDVVVSHEEDASINTSEVKMNQIFNYKLVSSVLPANRAYPSTDWSLTDTFDTVHDRYLDQYAIYAERDVYDENGRDIVYKKGEIIQTNATRDTEVTNGDDAPVNADTEADAPVNVDTEAQPETALFDVVYKDGTLTVAASKAFLALTNANLDKEAAFSVYVSMERIAPADKVVNTVSETHNGTQRQSRDVYTTTPERLGIKVTKYDRASGIEAGDRNSSDDALSVEVRKGENPSIEIGIRVENTGDTPLKDVTLTDEILSGGGTLSQITCPAELSDGLAIGEVVECQATLTNLSVGTLHTDTITATGTSIYTGKTVSDDDTWNGP